MGSFRAVCFIDAKASLPCDRVSPWGIDSEQLRFIRRHRKLLPLRHEGGPPSFARSPLLETKRVEVNPDGAAVSERERAGGVAAAAHPFFQLVSRRHERASLLIASNRPVDEWGQVFGDAVAATAVLEQWLHTVRSSRSGATTTGCTTSAAAAFCRRPPSPPRSRRRVD